MDEPRQSNTGAGMAEGDGPGVLQVLPALEAGGVERGTVQVTAALKQAGFRAYVASAGGRMVHEVERAGGIHIGLPLDTKNPLRLVANGDRLAHVINEHRIDLIHARSRAPAWSALSAARRTGKPFVTTFHSPYGHNWLKHHYNGVMARGDKVIAISAYIADMVRRLYGVDDGRLVTIPRGIDLEIFNPAAVSQERMIALSQRWRLPSDRAVVMLPGRLTRWKGQAVLLRALARLGRRDIACVLVGDDQGRERYRAELDALVKELDLESIVWIVDHCQDMAAAYMLADVVISASTDPEGFGRVAVEGQAMGRPVIATDHGGAKETVRSGETGWLVPPDDPDSLAEAIRFAIDLPADDRAWVAEQARANAVENYSADLMCARILDVYRSLLEPGR
jgi:glycosyltransferase involved in cell wall biosynthesis